MMNTYSVESILYNTYYRSTRGEGTIQEAIKRTDVWVDGATAYSVRVRPTFDGGIVKPDFWATVVVEGE